jgi:Na+-transporting NADH:ubiquinone oxidoreductase subunit NqrE
MAADLEADLAAALDDGVTPEEYVARDPHGFALAWATERGVIEPRRRIASTVIAAFIGAVPGVGLALFIAYGLSSTAMAEILAASRPDSGYPPTLELPPSALLALYGLGALFAYAGSVAAVAGVLRWRGDPAAARTVRSLGVLLPFGTAAAILATVAFASTRSFSTDARTVGADVLVASAVFALAVGAIRCRAVRQQRLAPSAPPHTSPVSTFS